MQKHASDIAIGDEVFRHGAWHLVDEIQDVYPPLPGGQTLEVKSDKHIIGHFAPDDVVDVREPTAG